MDILFGILTGILAVILTIGVLYSLPSTKGWWGERVVRAVLKTLPKDRYFVLNNVKFYGRDSSATKVKKTKRGNWSCQIDHLVISPYGIFSIETKNFLGLILGNYHDKYLQRKVLGMSYRTYSPVHQNYRHLLRLIEKFPIIKANSGNLHSIICFLPPGKPRIKGSGAAVISPLSQLKSNILKYQEEVISMDDSIAITSEVRKASINHK